VVEGTTRGILVNELGSVSAVVAMSSQPDLWLAVEPAHLPHYSHTAVVVGSVIILFIIVLMVGITFSGRSGDSRRALPQFANAIRG